MSIVIGSMILCVIGTFILMWICSMLMGDDGLYVACFLFVALMFALLVKIYIKQEEIQENQAEILKKLISRSNELSAFEKLWVSNIVTKESIPSYSGLR